MEGKEVQMEQKRQNERAGDRAWGWIEKNFSGKLDKQSNKESMGQVSK